jgi:ParB family chromosome partitioning protein
MATLKVKLEDLRYDQEFNCRGVIDPESCRDLAASIEKEGLLQPLVIRVNTVGPQPWHIVAGHRRFIAVTLLGWDEVTCGVIEIDDLGAQRANFRENLDRKDMTPSQEMRSILKIYGKEPDAGHVAAELGRSRKWVNERLSIRKLEERIQREIDSKALTALDVSLLIVSHPDHRWDIVERLKAAHAIGRSTKSVARELKLRTRVRGKREILKAVKVLEALGKSPSGWEAMRWCMGEVSNEVFFGLSLAMLKKHGIIE